MTDIATWLGQQLDEDERVARLGPRTPVTANWSIEEFQPSEPGAVPAATWVIDDQQMGVGQVHGDFVAAHIARHDPARVLRGVAAKRNLLKLAADMRDRAADCEDYVYETYANQIEFAMAEAYADRDGYDPAWRVE